MNQPDASQNAEAAAAEPEESASQKPGGADSWARAVVDGVPDAGDDTQAEAAPPVEAPDDDEVVDVEIVEDDAAAGTAPAEAASADEDGTEMTVEDLVIDLERVTLERDQYLDASRRLQAEFENYKKQVTKREIEARERANESLVGELLPVLDAFDGAVANGAEDVVPMRSSFLDALVKHGLERIEPADGPFDPTLHEAVMHEDDSETDGPVVAEVMRAGYVWKGRVLRPAMVRTKG